MITDATPKEATDLKDQVRYLLRLENAAYQMHRASRSRCAELAKRQGLTNQEIADEYGITEAAVRGLIKRAGK